MERVALIGFGAIGRLVFTRLARGELSAQAAAIIVRPGRVDTIRSQVPETVHVCSSVPEALGASPSLFVECAGHAGLRDHGPAVLGAGADLLVASVGALSDAGLEAELGGTARASGAAILIPSGALGGLDALGSARYAGIDDVEYVSTKPVQAWRGTAAEQLIDLGKVERPTAFYSGTAREAARRFPQNANVAAAVALAGIGFDRTRVSLTADPGASANRHFIRARGAFGSIEVVVEGRTLPDNPKTSVLAPMSLLRAIASRSATLRIV